MYESQTTAVHQQVQAKELHRTPRVRASAAFSLVRKSRKLPCRKQQTMHIIQKIAVSFLTLLAFTTIYAQDDNTKVGNATYYGDRWHGRRTASGSSYHKDSLTCAHRTLPFGTLLHVRNPKNGKVVVVKVTDRGPYRANTILDLSRAAAQQIDMIRSGVAQVEVTQVLPATTPATEIDNETPSIPQFQLYDPLNGRYYTTVEWVQRDNNRKELAKAKAQAQRASFMAKAKKPRYRVLSNRATASAKKR